MRKEGWSLNLPIEEARRNEEVIALADSLVLRWIDELNGIVDGDIKAREIKRQIKALKKEENTTENRRKVKKLYNELDKLQFVQDYMCLIIDKEKDYYRACKGFSINGVKYKRLLGTNGGIKNSTIVFVSDKVHKEISRRIENDRNVDIPVVPAKLEAYKALTCSASIPVSTPNGLLVVNDCETEFISDIVYLTDECDGEPIMEYQKDQTVSMNASDGFGLMLPSLAERWSEELDLDYMVGGVNTRFSFEKGMVFTFDFVEFADKVAETYTVVDAWGDERDVRDVELVMTTSMVKLWDSYESCEDYLNKSLNNGYTFGITKTCPKELERERNLNYQFIQSYKLNDDEIEELIKPTMDEIRDVLGGDWKKSVLFLKGMGLDENNVKLLDNDYIKALMIEPKLIDDPFVKSNIYQLIHNRINEAKVGVLKVKGNYSIVSGDPYSLCQSIFDLPVTGLLKAGEIYNKFWADEGSNKLACFRAPMTCHNNIRCVKPNRGLEASHWYRYMNTCTILNSWDTMTAALNGCDFDGDLVMLTDNRVLVEKLEPLPALMCAQRRAEKCIPTEEDFIRSNISSFGNEIGQTTNWITSMFEVQSWFEEGSKEYNELEYRIRCGQLYQQNAIDKAKGIVCKPMPKYWHDRFESGKIDDEEYREFCRLISADKKPYFMCYIYPALMKDYKRFSKKVNENSMRRFGLTLNELLMLDEVNEDQAEFIKYYHRGLPVGIGNCVMNKICKRFEDEFDGFMRSMPKAEAFDYSILCCEAKYNTSQYYKILKLYEEYNLRIRSVAIANNNLKTDKTERQAIISLLNNKFKEECSMICVNEDELCNIVLDMCYKKSATKRFAWVMCSDIIIKNLLKKNNYEINIPVLNKCGDIEFAGERFEVIKREIEIV